MTDIYKRVDLDAYQISKSESSGFQCVCLYIGIGLIESKGNGQHWLSCVLYCVPFSAFFLHPEMIQHILIWMQNALNNFEKKHFWNCSPQIPVALNILVIQIQLFWGLVTASLSVKLNDTCLMKMKKTVIGVGQGHGLQYC